MLRASRSFIVESRRRRRTGDPWGSDCLSHTPPSPEIIRRNRMREEGSVRMGKKTKPAKREVVSVVYGRQQDERAELASSE